jgi:hypothetical protein
MTNPVPLPIHFKLPGRSYSQIGRKGNVALYSVYSDYITDLAFSFPFVLIGFELIVIKTKNGSERYPRPEQFGHSAWSIPKSFLRVCFARFRGCLYGRSKFQEFLPMAVPDRSPSSEERAHLAQQAAQDHQTPSEDATITPQRRVTLLKGQL